MTRELDITTQLVHAGERRALPTGTPVSTPVYTTATFTYDSMAEVDEVFAGTKQGYIYTRYGNPTISGLEESIATLEAGAGACAYASGMAALHASILACNLAPGHTILASQDLYGATLNLLYTIFGSFGVKIATADFCDIDALAAKVDEVRPRILVAETISNPLLKICDLGMCAEVAHAAGARLIVDNTFASPYLCQPIKHEANFVVHSATKYLGGHADVIAGITVARDGADLPALVGVMKLVGGVLGVWEAHEIMRGVKTLALRMDRQCQNARLIAERLAAHKGIGRVYYPGLDSYAPQAKAMLRAPHTIALVTIELRDNTQAAAFRFMDNLRMCVRATSLGDIFTSVLHPATASHREIAPARRKQLGITDGLVRISLGIEDAADIIYDIEQALEA